jgi:hypothetical protein
MIRTNKKVYEDAIKEVKSVWDLSKDVLFSLGNEEDQNISRPKDKNISRVSTERDKRSQSEESFLDSIKTILTMDVTSLFSKHGHCIRCGREIMYDLGKPYCRDCFISWSEWENPSHIEKFCHTCGKKDKSSMLYPQCRSCYQKSKDH